MRGSIVIYVLVAIFLTGALIALLASGTRQESGAVKLDDAALRLVQQVKAARAAVQECVQAWPQPRGADNPNPSFPLYCADETCGVLRAAPAAGIIGCPGAPEGQRRIALPAGDYATEPAGVSLRFADVAPEVVSRVKEKFSPAELELTEDGFRVWLLRRR